MISKVKHSFDLLKNYCEYENFKGWDPFDGLNSTFFQFFKPLYKIPILRLAWIQFFKRSPINFRTLFGVPKEYNSKGLGLFLAGYCSMYRLNPTKDSLKKIEFLAEQILKLRSKGYSGSCWGYNFDWQARAFFQPKDTPTVVATTFIAYALFDAYEITANKDYLDAAISTKDFVLKDLNRTYDKDDDYAFSYSPLDSTQVFNASLLGSRLLARIFSYTNDNDLIEEAKKSIRFCVKHQKENGSWSYGTLPFHYWIDNFHTGYNLECISEYQKYSGDTSYQSNIDKGLLYYLNTFFTDDGKSKYYNDKLYPIDIHNTSQLLITLKQLGIAQEHKGLVDKVFNWTIDSMQDKLGFFYYQLKPRFNSKTPYMRWAQAWMFLALAEYLEMFSKK